MVKDVSTICRELKTIDVNQHDLKTIQNLLETYGDELDTWMALAYRLVPEYYQESCYHAAEIVYQGAIERFGKSARLLSNIGVLYQRWRRLYEAIASFRHSIEIDAKYPKPRHNLAFCYELLGDYSTSGQLYRTALEIYDKEPDSWCGLANCLWELRRKNESIAAYERALEIEPEHTNSLFNYSAALAKAGRFNEASSACERVLKTCPLDQGAVYVLECILRQENPVLNRSSAMAYQNGWLLRTDVIPDIEIWPIKSLWQATVDSARHVINPLRTMSPQIFISYRWDNDELDSWCQLFAEGLVARGYRVVFDQAFGLKPEIIGIPLVLSTMVDSAYFVPILTEKYRRSVEFQVARDLTASSISMEGSITLEEWLAALSLARMGRMKLLGVWKEGPAVPAPFLPTSVLDARKEDVPEAVFGGFPEIENRGRFVPFDEPQTLIEQGKYVTRTAGVTFVDHSVNLYEILETRARAVLATCKSVER